MSFPIKRTDTDIADSRKGASDLAKDYKLEHIWKQGFPADKIHEEAVSEAEANARSQVEITGEVLSAEIIQTPEHEANNEFLVSLVFGVAKD